MTLGVASPRMTEAEQLASRPRHRGTTEAELFAGTRVSQERAACACGTDVVRERNEPIPAAVSRHNDTEAHQAWRAEQES